MSDERFLYLTTRGRKSGLPRQIEIWFVEHAGRFYMIAEMGERAGWLRNLRAHSEVTVSVGTRADQQSAQPSVNAHARIVDPEAEPALATEVRALMNAKYGWSAGTIAELAPLRSEVEP